MPMAFSPSSNTSNLSFHFAVCEDNKIYIFTLLQTEDGLKQIDSSVVENISRITHIKFINDGKFLLFTAYEERVIHMRMSINKPMYYNLKDTKVISIALTQTKNFLCLHQAGTMIFIYGIYLQGKKFTKVS